MPHYHLITLLRYDLGSVCSPLTTAGLLGRHPRKPLSKFVTQDNMHLCSEDALSFIEKVSSSQSLSYHLELHREGEWAPIHSLFLLAWLPPSCHIVS